WIGNGLVMPSRRSARTSGAGSPSPSKPISSAATVDRAGIDSSAGVESASAESAALNSDGNERAASSSVMVTEPLHGAVLAGPCTQHDRDPRAIGPHARWREWPSARLYYAHR